jgi:poly(hydroxyalkanoate) granule-associated protein
MIKKVTEALHEEKRLAQAVLDSAHHIWLAGLGAFGKAQQEGGKLFETLVKEGTALEAKTREVAGVRFEGLAHRATGTWDKLEQVFEDRVARSLKRLGVPTAKDVETLSKRVAELSARVDALIEQGGGEAKPKPARRVARKAA